MAQRSFDYARLIYPYLEQEMKLANRYLPSNLGVSYTGTMKFPDVRQFDERVCQSDAGGDPAPDPPTGL
jgi:hypothetical protein